MKEKSKMMMALFAIAMLAAAGNAHANIYAAGFDSDGESWTATGDGALDWVGAGGDPGGYLRLMFGSGLVPQIGLFRANASASGGAFTGNIFSYTGNDGLSLTFDFRADVMPLALSFEFAGALNSWVYEVGVGSLTLNTWQNWSVPLDDENLVGWSSPDIGNSYTAFIGDLANVSQMRVVTLMPETTESQVGLDNVTIIPEPGTMALLIMGLGMAAAYRRRR
jgi:hypothetical protein